MKYIKAIAILIIASFSIPWFKTWMDVYTDPVTGIAITDGILPDYMIAFMGAIPWILWPAAAICVIWVLTRPDSPKEPPTRYIQ
jgi:hypothetical protein